MAQQAIPTIKTTTAIAAERRWTTFTQGLFFVAGFGTFIMVFFGLATTALSDWIGFTTLFTLGERDITPKDIVTFLGGLALILFGLFTLKIVNIPILYSDTRKMLTSTGRKVGSVQSYITGLSFAAGWTPCIGPFLGAILTMSVQEQLGTRLALLTAYTLGLGIPFLLFALMFDRMTPVLNFLKRNMRAIEIVSGVLLIVIGVAVLTGSVAQWSRTLQALGPLDIETRILGSDSSAISVPIAALAGFLSFTSPCVLPLVPAYLGFIGGWAVNTAKKA